MNSAEQRSAFRIQMPDGQKRAALRVEGRSFDVQLVDASATGVAIACPLTVALDIDDRAELHTSGGGGLIRIVRKEVFSDGILLGAERVGDMSEAGGGIMGQIGELAHGHLSMQEIFNDSCVIWCKQACFIEVADC